MSDTSEVKPEVRASRRRFLLLIPLLPALAALTMVMTLPIQGVGAGSLTHTSAPGLIGSSPSAAAEPVPAVSASPSPSAALEDLFAGPAASIQPPPPKKTSGGTTPRATGGGSGSQGPYYGMSASAYCALKLTPYSISGTNVNSFLTAANLERAATGAPALTWSGTLASTAQSWSDQMAADQDANPTLEPGTSEWFAAVFRHSGSGYAENIAFNMGYANPVNKAQSGWMLSTGHCLNIMNPSYKKIGAGKAQAADGSWFLTEEFSF